VAHADSVYNRARALRSHTCSRLLGETSQGGQAVFAASSVKGQKGIANSNLMERILSLQPRYNFVQESVEQLALPSVDFQDLTQEGRVPDPRIPDKAIQHCPYP
jgi:hypothetical protein